MAILENIIVNDSDLAKYAPDLERYKFDSQTDFSDVINTAKKSVYRLIKEDYALKNPSLSDSEIQLKLQNVRDFGDETNLKDRIALLAISEIFLMNQMLDLAEAYETRAKDIPLLYYVDENSDLQASGGEIMSKHVITLGR